MRLKPRATREKPTADQQIEAALHDLDLTNPRDQAIQARWQREAMLPPLPDDRGAEILAAPGCEYNSDTRHQFREWLLRQPGGRELYNDWIKARMRLREEGKLAPDSATSDDGRRAWAQRRGAI
jgi:hypothetical protein